jgi:transcriptional regulator with XRE-family HTH domain
MIVVQFHFSHHGEPERITVQERIRQQRKPKGWSQQQLADLCGLHRTYIAGTERGERNVSVLSLGTLADVLRVDPGELLGCRA